MCEDRCILCGALAEDMCLICGRGPYCEECLREHEDECCGDGL